MDKVFASTLWSKTTDREAMIEDRQIESWAYAGDLKVSTLCPGGDAQEKSQETFIELNYILKVMKTKILKTYLSNKQCKALFFQVVIYNLLKIIKIVFDFAPHLHL